MSKEIKITIVSGDGKLNGSSELQNENSIIMTHDSTMTLMSTLLKNHLISGSFCGGRGDCGRCRVQFLEGAALPTVIERSVMEPEELRQGYRLACLAKPKDNCVIKLDFMDAPEIAIISDMIDVPENNDYISQQNKELKYRKTDVTESAGRDWGNAVGKTETDMFRGDKDKSGAERKEPLETGSRMKDKITDVLIAADLGTTTIAMQLMNLADGRVIDTYCEMNPQRRYGSDVLSRIKASCEGNRAALQQLVMAVLERGVSQFEKCLSEPSAVKKTIIRGMCIAGNTTMEHLFMGYDVSSLGCSPFTPVEIGLQEYRHPAWDFKVWLVPGISAFVGGDIVAGLYALHMLPCGYNEQTDPAERPEAGTAVLLIDLGTNGEMAITDKKRMIVTATAAGPAFEGGAGAGIVGSDMISCTASLLQKGVLDETGLLTEPYFTEGITVGSPAVRLCGKDIRDLQMAKAAVRAGVEVLWEKMGKPEIGKVYLAGGFGYYLDVEAAFRIGLLPEQMHGRVQAVGNTSLAGAFRMGRDLCRNRIDGRTLDERISSIESMNLAEQEEFEELYIKYINFPQ